MSRHTSPLAETAETLGNPGAIGDEAIHHTVAWMAANMMAWISGTLKTKLKIDFMLKQEFMPICQSMFLKLYVCPSVHGQYVLDIQSLYYSGFLFTHFMKVWYGAPKLPSHYFSKTQDANGVCAFFHSKRINTTSSPESIQISPETSGKNPRIPYVPSTNQRPLQPIPFTPPGWHHVAPTGLGTYRQMLDFTQAEGPRFDVEPPGKMEICPVADVLSGFVDNFGWHTFQDIWVHISFTI